MKQFLQGAIKNKERNEGSDGINLFLKLELLQFIFGKMIFIFGKLVFDLYKIGRCKN